MCAGMVCSIAVKDGTPIPKRNRIIRIGAILFTLQDDPSMDLTQASLNWINQLGYLLYQPARLDSIS